MAAEVREILIKIRGESRDAEQSAQRVARSFTELNQAVELSKTIFAGSQRAVEAFFSAMDGGNRILNLRQGFETLRQTTGAYDVSLAGLRESTRGLISDTELLATANKALAVEFPQEQLERTIGLVQEYSTKLGRDAAQDIERFILGTTKLEKELLDEFGILVTVNEATEDFARKHNKAAKDLSEFEKRTAFVNLALERLEDQNAKTGAAIETAGSKSQRFRTELANLKDDALAAFASNEDLGKSFDEMATAIASIDVEDLALIVNALIKLASIPAGALVDIGSALGHIAFEIKEMALNAASATGIIDDQGRELDRWRMKLADAEAQLKKYNEGSVLWERQKAYTEGVRQQVIELEKQTIRQQEVRKTSDALFGSFDNLTKQYMQLNNEFGRGELELARTQQEKSIKAAEEAAKAQEKFTDAVKKANDEYTDFLRDVENNNLEESLRRAAEAGDKIGFEKLGKQLEESYFEGLIEAHRLAAQSPEVHEQLREMARMKAELEVGNIEGDVADAQQKAAEKAAEEYQRAMEAAYRESVDFWEDILIGAVEGNIKDVLENMLIRAAIKFGAEMLAQVTGAFSAKAFFDVGGAGFDIASLFQTSGVGPVANGNVYAGNLAGGVGALGALGTLGLGAVAGYYGYYGTQAITGLTNSTATDDAQSGVEAALLSTGPVLGWLAPAVGALGLSSGKDKGQQIRDGIRDFLQEQGVIDDDYMLSLFGGGQFNLGAENIGNGQSIFNLNDNGEFAGLGNLLSSTLGGEGTQLAAMFTNALAATESFNAAVLTTIGIFDDLGLSTEQVGDQLTAAMLDGSLSLEQYNADMATLALLSQDTLGSIAEGFELLADTAGGPPRDQLKALELTFTELREAGVQDINALKNVVAQELGVEAVAIFEEMAAAGIDQFTDFSTLSNAQIGLVINLLSQLIPSIKEVGTAADQASGSVERAAGRMVGSLSRVKREADETGISIKHLL